MILVQDILSTLNKKAPFSLQESYDNSGLIIGDLTQQVSGICIALDCTLEVLKYAKKHKANLVVTHHPILFKPIRKIGNQSWEEKIIRFSIKHNINILSIHTNLDNIKAGVNDKIGEKLGLKNLNILSPKSQILTKLITFVPIDHFSSLREALFSAGAGAIGNYDHCSFSSDGIGSYRPNQQAKPYKGTSGITEQVKEKKLEVIFPNYLSNFIVQTLEKHHPYQDVAYDLLALKNASKDIGAGMIGTLDKAMALSDFLALIKKTFKTSVIKYAVGTKKKVRKIAFCGGSGFFLLKHAIAKGADVLLTSDLKYHDFFEAKEQIHLIDIGHYESEQFTNQLIKEILREKFPKFAIRIVKTSTNPVKYYL